MAETAKYIWSAFDFTVATNGTRVGFQQADDNDISQTGLLVKDVSFALASHKVIIDGMTLWINNFGNVVKTIPDSEKVGMTVRMVSCEMKTTYGTQQGITRAPSEGIDAETTADISSLEPRDQFALCAMQAIMRTIPEPQSLDDANILFMCQASYRWAQGMMIAAADARATVEKIAGSRAPEVDGGEGQEKKLGYLDVNTNQITSLTDKLLYNIGIAVDNLRISEDNNYKDVQKKGMPVVGSSSTGAAPVKTELTKMPEVAIKGTPKVEISNEPTVKVSNMPSEPISVSGTVSVDNFPSTETSNS